MEGNLSENVSTAAYYLRDLGFLLKERALAAKKQKCQPSRHLNATSKTEG